MTSTIQLFQVGMKGSLFIFLTGAFLGCGAKEGSDSNATAGGHVYVVPVEVAVAEMKRLSVNKTYSGTLEGEDQANVVARLSERVTAVEVHVGQSVRAGQIILSLDKSGASSQYFQAEANYKNAGKTLERIKSLYGEGAVSLQSLDGAQTAFDVAKANFDAARSTVELTTPIAGVVTTMNVSTGDLAAPNAVLAAVATIGRMKVIFNLNETDVTNLSIGQKVHVYSETRPETKVEGKVIQFSKSADARSRSFEIKALFSNTADRWFKPGMFCKVDLQVSPPERTLVIPNVAIQSDGVTDRVFVVRNGRAYQRTIRPGITDGRSTAVLEGLADQDTIATVGINKLQDSTFVTVVH